ncbi:MAG: nucleotidyltransferase domain-containing protein [Flavobacteriia bacterium]|jgi:predicted nucleotidyltransferase
MNEDSKYGLSDADLTRIISVCKANSKIDKAILFGSRAKGNYQTGSDIDIALIGANLKLDDVLNLSIELDNLDLAYKFDLLIFDRIKEEKLIEHIERVGVDLFS